MPLPPTIYHRWSDDNDTKSIINEKNINDGDNVNNDNDDRN